MALRDYPMLQFRKQMGIVALESEADALTAAAADSACKKITNNKEFVGLTTSFTSYRMQHTVVFHKISQVIYMWFSCIFIQEQIHAWNNVV